MNVAQVAGSRYALLADGTTAEIRPATPDDFDAVKAMHEAMSPDNAYLRFFGLSRTAAADEARRTCLEGGPGHVALLALSGGVVAGCASYHLLGAPAGREERTRNGAGDVAEIAFAVADRMHHRGIATLLLEHLVSVARSRQIQAFTAETLTENTAMLRVFADAGLPVRHPHGQTSSRLRTLLPDGGTVTGPVDTTAAVTADDFRQCLELLAADEDVDAIIALVLPTAATGDLVAAIQEADARVPLAAVVLSQAESVRLLPRPASRAGTDGAGKVPAYGYPEAAAAALARAARYGIWRGQPRGHMPDFPDIRAADARSSRGRTGYSSWTRRSRPRPASRKTHSCGDCGDISHSLTLKR
jgi:GNAT superfamily N-acetyltransferase